MHDPLEKYRCKFEPRIPILEQTELDNRRYRAEQAKIRRQYEAKRDKEIAKIDAYLASLEKP